MIAKLKQMADSVKESLHNDGISEADIEAMVNRKKFSDYLPWRAYDPKERAYITADDRKGFIWEFRPVVFAGKTTYQGLEDLLQATVPIGTVVQTVLWADPDIGAIIDEYLAMRENHANRRIAENTARMYKAAASEGFEKISAIPARNFRGFFAVKLPECDRQVAADLRDAVEEALRGCGLMPRVLEPQRLCTTLQRIFNDAADVPGDQWRYEEQLPVSKQIISGGTRTKIEFDHIKLGFEKRLAVQTVSQYPGESLEDMTLNEVIGRFMGGAGDSAQCNMPFWLSVNIVVEDLSYLFHGKSTMMMNQEKKGSKAGFKMDRQNEMLWAARESDRGKRFVRVIPSIISMAKDEAGLIENTTRINNLWKDKGFTLDRDKGILGPLFLLSMPLGLYNTKNNIDLLERDRIMAVDAAARMLPVQGDYCGSGKPMSLFLGRKGQIITLDTWDPASNNYNIIVTGTSGSGKTYTMNRTIDDLFSTGTIIRVFDLGGGYEKLSHVQKGKFIRFSRDSNISVNPFTTIRHIDDEIGLLGKVIAQMIWSSSKEKPLETQMTVIKTAARQVWNDFGPEGDIDRVQKVLQNFDACMKQDRFAGTSNNANICDIAGELAFNLSDFTGDGAYARWFRGKASLDIKHDRFVVLELEELIAMEELFNVVIMQVVNAVTRNLYLSNRENPQTIIFEEAWKWFKEGSFLGDVVESGYRLARRYHGSFITVFQSLLDLKKFGKTGDSINENSAYKLLLHQKNKYDKAVNEKMIDLSPFELEIANSLRLKKGCYSEVFIHTPHNRGVARLPADMYSHLVFTSDAKENTMINKVARQLGVDKHEAIEQLCRKEN